MDFMRIGIFLGVLFVAYVGWRVLNPYVFSGMARALGAHKVTPLPSADMRPERTDAPPARVSAPRAVPAAASAPAGGFDRRAVEAVGGDWEEAAKLNGVLAGLAALRQTRVAREGALRARVAWKVAVFRQAALHRLVGLGAGAAAAWNGRNVLGAALAAQGVLEAVALLQDFDRTLARLLGERDLAGIDALVMARAFASPVDGLADGAPSRASVAVSVAGLIEAGDAAAREHYEALAGLCDAGALGQYRVFGEFDKAGTAVTFSAEAGYELGLLGHVIGGVAALVPAEASLRAIEEKLAQIAALDPAVA